jgi:small redox-active disulfide protein 2
VLAQRVEEAAKELGLAVEVQKVTNMDEIMEYDILMTPGLVLDEKLVVSGRVPSVEEIKGLLK